MIFADLLKQGPVWKSHVICPDPEGPQRTRYLVVLFIWTHIFSLLTLFSLKVLHADGQITPNTVTHPCHGSVLNFAKLKRGISSVKARSTGGTLHYQEVYLVKWKQSWVIFVFSKTP